MRILSKKRLINRAKLIIVLVLCAIVFISVEVKVRPIANEITSHISREIAVNSINEAVKNLLRENEKKFTTLTEIKYDRVGGISSVHTKVSEINLLQAEISQRVSENLNAVSTAKSEIRLGTLSGMVLLNDLGPKVRIHTKPMGNVNTRLASVFKSAGINQTNHQIILNVDAEVKTIFLGRSHKNIIAMNYILADTVIVGNVPESYTYISGDDRDLISKSNDYK